MKITKETFGILPDGREAQLFTLSNDNNIKIKITNYGAIITSIETPDKNGNIENIACGFEKLETYFSDEYLETYPYFGCIIGRFGNRIANGKFEIEGKTYEVAVNNGPNHLHGGLVGYDKRLFDYEIVEDGNQPALKLTYLSPDGEENYPGNLEVTCIYSLNNKNELGIEYFAETDKTTVINLTNHSYFNLNAGKNTILDHELMLTATKMTEMVDQIPTGKIVPVENTPFDFTSYKALGKDFDRLTIGYDDNYVLDNESGELKFVGCVRENTSGRKMEVYTTQPGMQLYTGHWIPNLKIDGEEKFGRYSAFAMETQHYPDSVNQPDFPSTILKPGEKYNHKTIYQFGLI